MRNSIIFTVALFVSLNVLATDLKYPVSEIPVELKENVDVVIREDEIRFKILAKNKATHYVHYVVTIFNENGNNYASQVVGYNKLTKVIDFNGYVYDALGKQTKRLKNNEIYDQASFDGFSLYSDHRLKAANLSQATYPYTVEFEYELELKYLYSISGSAFGGEKKSTQHATYQLIYPTDLKPNYKLLNLSSTPRVEKTIDGYESVTWNFLNIMPMKFEAYGPDHEELIPQIIAAPSKFEYEGYEGDMTSWKTYGQWNALLNQQRDDLPEATKLKVKELTKGLTTNEQKAKAIYEYLQSKTRYVSIQLGIGGLQPFPASMVDQTGYGDCKALSNYAIAMLKEVGVKGYYSIIQAGRGEGHVRKEFPSHQFNHVLVSVPNGRDTLWLECTSQANPFGYQGSFTEDRFALLVTDQGGKLVKTINYSPEQNSQSRTAEVELDATGNAKAKIRTTNKGIQYENDGLDNVMNNVDDQKKMDSEQY